MIDVNAIVANNNEEVAAEEIKHTFTSHCSKILRDPNDFYINLTKGIEATIILPNQSPSIGYIQLSSTLSQINFFIGVDADKTFVLKPEKIDKISVISPLDSTDSHVPPSPFAGTNIYIETTDGSFLTFHIESYYYHQLWAYMLYCYNDWYRSLIDDKIFTYQPDVVKGQFTAYISNIIVPKTESKDIPEFLIYTINRLNELQCGIYEGIFRHSAKVKLVEYNVTILNKGYYEIYKLYNDANVCAAVLKQWLRDLSDPIVYIYIFRYQNQNFKI